MSRRIRFWQWALLACMALWWSGCFGLGGGGGGIDPQEPKYINATFKSNQGKIVVFTDDGNYKFYVSAEKQSAQQPLLDSKYEIKGKDIFFSRELDSQFSEPGKLSEDGNSFTWAEHPDETFTKEQ